MRIHSTHRTILDYLADHESITVTQAVHLLYGDKVTRPQITSARRTLNNMTASGILLRGMQDGKAVFTLASQPERETIKDRITWLFTDDGQQWLMAKCPSYAFQSLAIYQLVYLLEQVGAYSAPDFKYTELRRMLGELVEEGRLTTTAGHRESAANGRTYRSILWLAPGFNPTPEQLAKQKAREEEHRKESVEAFVRGWLMAR